MNEYARIPTILGFIPYLAVGCYVMSFPLLYSLTPILLLIIMDIWTSLQLQADMDTPYEAPRGVLAANGRLKLRQMVPPKTGKRYLIVGCGGVGNRMIEILQERGEDHVYGMDLKHNKETNALDESHQIVGDVTSLESCKEAIQQVQPDVVFHTAAFISSYSHGHESQWPKSYMVNVKGVLNMLEASCGSSVKAFVLTSSSTAGLSLSRHANSIVMGDEADFPPVTDEHDSFSWYTRSKAMAEVEALKLVSNKENAPAFGIIRPGSYIFHQRDTVVMKEALKEFKAPAIGFERRLVDHVYCDNVVLGHLLLEKALHEGKCNGETFLITNREPMTAIDFFRRIKHYYKRRRATFVYYKLPALLVWTLAQVTGVLLKLGCPLPGDLEKLSPITLEFTTVQYVMKDDKARKMLGYNPAFTVNEGILQMIEDQKEISHRDLVDKMKKKDR